MKTVLFVTATAKEMKAAFGGVCTLPKLEQGQPVSVKFGKKSVLLLVTGIGVINVALALGQALSKFDVERVFLAGIAGTFNPELFPWALPVWSGPKYGQNTALKQGIKLILKVLVSASQRLMGSLFGTG